MGTSSLTGVAYTGFTNLHWTNNLVALPPPRLLRSLFLSGSIQNIVKNFKGAVFIIVLVFRGIPEKNYCIYVILDCPKSVFWGPCLFLLGFITLFTLEYTRYLGHASHTFL